MPLGKFRSGPRQRMKGAMSVTEDPKYVCHLCIGESYLSDKIKNTGKQAECSYCSGVESCIDLELLADEVEGAFERHYRRTSTEPDAYEWALIKDRESAYEWEREGESVVDLIADRLSAREDIATDVQEILGERHVSWDPSEYTGEESEFDSNSQYVEVGPSCSDWHERWERFEASLKMESRFFNQEAMSMLEAVFFGLDGLRSAGEREVFIQAGPRTKLDAFYRARVFQSEQSLKEALCAPDKQLGPPPSASVRAGRMNAHGISVFYGSDEPRAALAEVRPPVGSYVVVARFDVIRPLRLLDLTALADAAPQKGSVFDPQFREQQRKVAFLNTLQDLMIRPVMPDDEASDYLPTQAIADYLATSCISPIDGIVFPSVQDGKARNVVLFHKSSLVEPINLPEGATVRAHLWGYDEDGRYPDFSVSISVPKGGDMLSEAEEHDFPNLLREPRDSGEPALRVDTDSIKVHHVKRVQVCTSSHVVHRHRYESSRSDSAPDF